MEVDVIVHTGLLKRLHLEGHQFGGVQVRSEFSGPCDPCVCQLCEMVRGGGGGGERERIKEKGKLTQKKVKKRKKWKKK